MIDPAANLATLRKCGIPEWVLVDEDWKEFVDFFKENISDANILTDQELVELARFKADENKNKIPLTKRMQNIDKEYDGIWSITEDDVTELEKLIEIYNQEEEFYDDLIAKAKSNNMDAIEELTVLKRKQVKLSSEEPIVANNCLKQMEELHEVKMLNERKINELEQLYSKPGQNPLFMHQMPLNDYFRQLEQFNKNAKLFTQKNFKLDGDEKSFDDKTHVLTELGVTADRLLNAYNKCFMAEMVSSAKNTLTNHFKAKNWTPSTLMGMRREMLQMERDNEMNESQKLHLVHKLQEQATELAQLDVEAVINDSNQKRMGRAKQRIDHLTRFADIISDTMLLSELIWVLMQLDMERMKNRKMYDSKLDVYRMESLGCNRRIELMNSIGKLNGDTFVLEFCKQLMDMLQMNQKNYDESAIEQIIKCILTVDEFKSSISTFIQSMGNDFNSILNNHDFFSKATMVEELIRKFLYDGPVARPQQFSTWYRKKNAYLDREYQAIRKKNGINKQECTECIKRWSNDKYWRYKQTLWIWFMTEPKKVLKALKSISLEAQQRSKNERSTARPTVGIVRKT